VWSSASQSNEAPIELTSTIVFAFRVKTAQRGTPSDVLGVRIVVTNYDAASGLVGIDLTENGKVIHSERLMLDKQDHALVSFKDGQRYYRRSDTVPPGIMKGLELVPRS
jgi:hypothetical protein